MKHPNMHDELKFHLSYLADEDYQKQAWVHGHYDRYRVNFKNILDFIINDARLDDAYDCIGWYIRDETEARYVQAVADAILAAINIYNSGDMTDAKYIATPEWQRILTTAKAALAVVRAGSPGHG